MTQRMETFVRPDTTSLDPDIWKTGWLGFVSLNLNVTVVARRSTLVAWSVIVQTDKEVMEALAWTGILS